jgi:hypothetical protein
MPLAQIPAPPDHLLKSRLGQPFVGLAFAITQAPGIHHPAVAGKVAIGLEALLSPFSQEESGGPPQALSGVAGVY